MKRAVITGATGLVGGNLAEALQAHGGVRLVCTRRPSSRVAHLEHLDIEWVQADLGEPDTLARAFDGADVVFHCAADVRVSRDIASEQERSNVAGTTHTLSAAALAGVGRLVHCSSVAAVGVSLDGQPVDESVGWNHGDFGLASPYARSKHLAEIEVARAVEQGLDAVIVNPSYMLGPCDPKPSSGKMILAIARREIPGYTDGSSNFVDVRDVARGMVAAWERGVSGQRYILGGHNLTYRQAFSLIAERAGVSPPRWPIPFPVALAGGWLAERWGRVSGSTPDINSQTVRAGYGHGTVFSSEKAKRELGYSWGPLEPAVDAALEWFRGQGMLP